jgi:hypothetical protein
MLNIKCMLFYTTTKAYHLVTLRFLFDDKIYFLEGCCYKKYINNYGLFMKFTIVYKNFELFYETCHFLFEN